FEFVMNMIDHGDLRIVVFLNAHRCIVEAEGEAKTSRAKHQLNKLKEKLNKAINALTKPNQSIQELIFHLD
ncbi:TPA: hypothetical protein ACSP0P_004752, partial [Citrobacter freundii]